MPDKIIVPVYSLETLQVTLENGEDYVLTVYESNDGYHAVFRNESELFEQVDKNAVQAIGLGVKRLEGADNFCYADYIGRELYNKLWRVF